MNQFTEDEVAEIREKLAQRLLECSGQVKQGVRELMSTCSEKRPFPGDDAEDLGSDFVASVTTHRKGQCESLAHALDRLKLGLLGVCADCGEDIPRTRIAATNEAVTCFECQELREGPREVPDVWANIRERSADIHT